MKGKELIVIMGKSGSGKDSLVKEILKCSKTLRALIPYTTRPMRPNEENGKDYFFVSPESFEEHVKSNDFAAMTEYHTVQGIWKYGIPKIEKPGMYILVATPDQVQQIFKSSKGKIKMQLFLLECDEEMRIIKLFERENKKTVAGKEPDYKEIIRRLLTDREDFENIRNRLGQKGLYVSTIDQDYVISPEEMAKEFLYNYKID